VLKGYPLTIGFVGGIRYFDINKKIIDAFANNKMFNLMYVGKKHPGCDLEKYCNVRSIKNVRFLPAYHDEGKPQIYKDIDIINSIYGNSTMEVRTALPNKLYDAVLYKKPILVSKGTFLGEVIGEYNLGLAVDSLDGIDNALVKYLECFDETLFLNGCEKFLHLVYKEQEEALESFNKFINAMRWESGSSAR